MWLPSVLLASLLLVSPPGCVDEARSLGESFMAKSQMPAIDHWSLQPREPVSIGGEHFAMTGSDRCPDIGFFEDKSHDCLTLSADKRLVRVRLDGHRGSSTTLLALDYRDGQFRLSTLGGEPVIGLR